ncbi:MAG: sodium/proline symporter [Deltaproteobacteria bacterium]|nr:sodium/proline symporter [Deltaproteobacteria bacterium]
MSLFVAFAVYGLVLVSIGVVSYRRDQKADDFLIGSRKISYWVTALSAHASDMSSWLFLGFPVAIYTIGISEAWVAVGLLLGMALTWKFVAPRLRISTEETGSITLSHFFSARVGDQTRLISLTAAFASLFFFTFYIASGLQGMGTVLEALFGIPMLGGVLLSALLVIVYTTLGGYMTVAFTDAFQAVFLLLAILVVPIFAFFSLPDGMTIGDGFTFGEAHSVSQAVKVALNWGLGYFGMPHVLTKFMGIRKAEELKKSMRLGLAWQFLALSAAVSIGILGWVFFKDRLEVPQYLFLNMVNQLFSPLAAGFIFCGVVAATLSTVDSQIIVSASVVTKDIVNALTERRSMLSSRLSIVCQTSIAAVITLTNSQSVYEIVRYAWSGQGSTFGPIVLCSLYYRGLTKWGAFAGMTSGALLAALWPLTGWVFADAPMIPGFFGSLGVIFLVSKFTRGNPTVGAVGSRGQAAG